MVIKKVFLSLCLVSSFLNSDVFEKGKLGVGVTLGTSQSYNNTYTIAGLSANYFVVDNLNVGIAYRGWFGGTPTKNELSLSTNYFIPLSEQFRPYIGLFVRETFVSDGFRDFESYGARGGLAFINENTYVSIGYAYEEYGNCLFGECSNSYPELIFGLSF